MANLETYRRTFMEVLGVSEDALNADFVFGRVKEWDSMAHMALIEALQAMAGICSRCMRYYSNQQG